MGAPILQKHPPVILEDTQRPIRLCAVNMTLLGIQNYAPDKELEEKLKRAAKVRMTKEQSRAQKISYVFGNLPVRLRLTREEVEKIVDEGLAGVIDLQESA